MLIDCERCRIRGAGCSGCLVTALLDESSTAADLGAAESRAIEMFVRAGFEVDVLPAPRPPAAQPRPLRRRRIA
ncbi:hypothetical protein [Micromonospora avicenniae]|uniref:Uncharacterized protein n=1 Tax=Micromonospora avicenniae TaxID=1198245 RepID=A0A1N6SPJ1_9ACTN|nr:hypothetical protein [Micromonospora avicenniae]SIQ43013.1 hypothetical protein SAMN05444858_102346 [Micromonospora avicenniae]